MKQFAFKRLALCAMALFCLGIANAATETYDFKTLSQALSDEYTMPTLGENVANDMMMISLGENTFNNRFSTGPRAQNSGGTNCFRFRKTSNWEGLHNYGGYSGRYFSIRNLKAGDKITITLNSSNNSIKFRNTADATEASVKGVTLGTDAVTSGQEYEIESDGIVNLETTGTCIIEKVVIEPASEKITIGATTENYNFAAIASGTSFTETGAASTTIALATADNDFNNRFSLGTDSRNIAFKGAGYGLQLIYANRGLFINNLKAGDQVKIAYTTEGSQVFKFVNGGNVGEAATATVTSDAWYTVETDGQLQMINTTNAGSDKTNITAVEIRTFKAATTATTLVCSKALDFSGTDVEAYIATSTTTSAVTLTQVNKVAPNTPLWIKADEGGYYQIPLLYDTADDTDGNMLLAGTSAKVTAPANHTYYVYGTPAGGTAGFYKVGTGGITVPTGKAYLDVAATGAPNFLNISFGEDFGQTTSLTEMEDKRNAESGVFYNLSGLRVAQPAKGLYIVNGKKVVIK